MRGEDCYAALGLRPGASRAQVDEAYRRLIKRYHPDRTGGDGRRAAEINRAYSQIRRNGPHAAVARKPVPAPVPQRRPQPPRRAAALALVGLSAAVLGGFFAFNEQPARSARAASAVPAQWLEAPGTGAGLRPLTNFEAPLNGALVDQAIAEAVRLHSAGDGAVTVAFSRSCHTSMRDRPSLERFDSCAAFDEATVTLNRDNVLAESGAFATSKVISRQMAAAQLLSGDPLAAEARLREIRSRVELALVAQTDPLVLAGQERPSS